MLLLSKEERPAASLYGDYPAPAKNPGRETAATRASTNREAPFVKNTLAAGLLTGTLRAEQCFQTLVPCFFRDPRFRRTLTASKEARSRVGIQLSDFAEGAAAGLVGVGR
jgi:hypothetical protein